mgnify:CR=1 FL=1
MNCSSFALLRKMHLVLFKMVSYTAQDAILNGKGSHASVDMQAFCGGKVRNVSVMDKGMLSGADVK